ncbi:hypothetical protein GQ600_4148 [Phytophthora cactorum]|nr:hypothetical protein GQ600_4148 [Phytophthora cactorum]
MEGVETTTAPTSATSTPTSIPVTNTTTPSPTTAAPTVIVSTPTTSSPKCRVRSRRADRMERMLSSRYSLVHVVLADYSLLRPARLFIIIPFAKDPTHYSAGVWIQSASQDATCYEKKKNFLALPRNGFLGLPVRRKMRCAGKLPPWRMHTAFDDGLGGTRHRSSASTCST